MLRSAREAELGDRLETQVCIIGGGPLGIALALELSATNDVLLLEAGEASVSSTAQEFYAGSAEGTILPSNYLQTSRLSCLGGSSQHWAGWCLPFSPYDFSEKPWLSQAAWPIAYEEIEPYFAKAASYVEVPAWEGDAGMALQPGDPLPDAREFVGEMFHISPPTRFGDRYRKALTDASRLTVLTSAPVKALRLSEAKDRVVGVEVYLPEGRVCTVSATTVILAAGGIESPRIISLSDDCQHLCGNTSWLGAGFTDHAEVTVGIALVPKSLISLQRFVLDHADRSGNATLRMLFPSYTKLVAHQLNNFAVQFTPLSYERCPESIVRYAAVRSKLVGEEVIAVHLRIRPEPRPRQQNRLTRSHSTDTLGRPQVSLRWELSETERLDLFRAAQLVAEALVNFHNAAVNLLLNEDTPWEHAQFGSHHLCTTRMSLTADDGVVDAQCRVHGLSNLFIAGSSVFRSAGVANPTLTALALGLRVVDQVRREGN